jgi:hypothetical protein
MDGACGTCGERRDTCKVLVPKPEEKGDLGNLGVGGRIILKQIFMKLDGRHGLDLRGSRQDYDRMW